MLKLFTTRAWRLMHFGQKFGLRHRNETCDLTNTFRLSNHAFASQIATKSSTIDTSSCHGPLRQLISWPQIVLNETRLILGPLSFQPARPFEMQLYKRYDSGCQRLQCGLMSWKD